MAFGLVNNLYVGSFKDGNNKDNGYDISELHFDFEVSRSVIWYENYAKFKVYNASVETINRILYEGAGIIHECGYENEQNGVGTLFVGNITKVWCEISGNDVVTNIVATSTRGAEYQLVKVPISLAFKKGDTLFAIVKTIADYSAMPLVGASSLNDVFLDDDFSFEGSVNAALKAVNVILSEFGGRMYFDNSMLAFIDESGDETQMQEIDVVNLDFSSGLIFASPMRENDDGLLKNEVERNLAYYYFGGRNPKNGKPIEYKKIADNVQKRLKIRFRSFINPGIVPNTKIRIDNSGNGLPVPSVNGTYLVRNVTFKGNNYGGKCECDGEAVE